MRATAPAAATALERFRQSPAMLWSDALELGLPVAWDWRVSIEVVDVSRSDPKARHKRATTSALRCAVNHPPFHLRHRVTPMVIAWSIDLTAGSWSGGWVDTDPARPLVDGASSVRPVKYPLEASLLGFPSLAATVAERMKTRFFLEEAKVSVGVGYPRSSGLPKATAIEQKIRTWLASGR